MFLYLVHLFHIICLIFNIYLPFHFNISLIEHLRVLLDLTTLFSFSAEYNTLKCTSKRGNGKTYEKVIKKRHFIYFFLHWTLLNSDEFFVTCDASYIFVLKCFVCFVWGDIWFIKNKSVHNTVRNESLNNPNKWLFKHKC